MGQQGDVLLFQTNDGGDVSVEGGLVEMSGGLETAAYLSLFGGNEQDDGRQGTRAGWWGNTVENQPERQYRSETQFLVRSIPSIPANLRRIEQAAQRDLAWLVDVGAATEVTAEASMPGPNKVRLRVKIDAVGLFEFEENWRADAV